MEPIIELKNITKNYGEKQVRQITTLENDIKDLKWRYNVCVVF